MGSGPPVKNHFCMVFWVTRKMNVQIRPCGINGSSQIILMQQLVTDNLQEALSQSISSTKFHGNCSVNGLGG